MQQPSSLHALPWQQGCPGPPQSRVQLDSYWPASFVVLRQYEYCPRQLPTQHACPGAPHATQVPPPVSFEHVVPVWVQPGQEPASTTPEQLSDRSSTQHACPSAPHPAQLPPPHVPRPWPHDAPAAAHFWSTQQPPAPHVSPGQHDSPG